MKKNIFNTICVVIIVSWMLSVGLLIYNNYQLKSEILENEALIERLTNNINVLKFSNYSYEQYIQRKVMDGELVEISTVETD